AETHLARCLGCLACEPACPSGVAYRELISPFRAWARSQPGHSHAPWLRSFLESKVLPYPDRFRLVAKAGTLARSARSWLPRSIRPMLDLLPDKLPRPSPLPSQTPAKGERRARVALLTGCVQQVLEPDINLATI